MDIPFKVIFTQPVNHRDEYLQVEYFTTEEKALYQMEEEKIPVVKENINLSLEFLCEDEDARFYMDGLDTLPARELYGEEDDTYLPPTYRPVVLFKFSDKEDSDEYYPLIPGYYRIKVIAYGKKYYSWLRIAPKQITEEQWTTMRDEIEETVNGLAQDLIRKNASMGMNSIAPIPFHMLRKLYLIKKDFSKWSMALRKITKEPRMKIGKEYKLVPEGRVGLIDEKSIRYRTRHPESRGFIYTSTHTSNYNLPENRWMKYISRFMIRELNLLTDYLVTHKEKVISEVSMTRRFQSEDSMQVKWKERVLEEIDDYTHFVRRARSWFITLSKAEWMRQVDKQQPSIVPHVMQLDAKYKQIYQMYRLLRNDDYSITLDTNYDYFWKRTDLLYEIWGFLSLIKGLQEEKLGYEVLEGWIFEASSDAKSIHVPFVDPGTKIKFKKGDYRLSLVYDALVPASNRMTSVENPLFTNGYNTRPDVRMDMYHKQEYIGSIIMDFKYRPPSNIWNNKKTAAHKQYSSMKQLLSYRNNMDSPSFLYSDTNPILGGSVRPAHEVWAVYPKHKDNKHVDSPKDDYAVHLNELTPSGNNQPFFDALASAIDKIIDRYQAIK